MSNLSPKQIVAELDRFIIGQEKAKKAVAIALRNRHRRQLVEPESLREEIMPKNILMIGPTGCGKTEIARRLAKLANAPFIKVEATKFTEVGYVGRDVDSIIRDLVETAIDMIREQKRKEVESKAEAAAEERVLLALVGENASEETKAKFRAMLHNNELNDREIEIDVEDAPQNPMNMMDIPGMPGGQMGMINLGDMIGKAMGGARTKRKKMTVEDSYEVLMDEESDKLIDEDKVIREALEAVERDGIVFLDEVDKIAARSDTRGGDVSREGVQRDLLPLIEGTYVPTKYGTVQTDHILFIASGAFHTSKPSDLLPELQGRLPIRVELEPLSQQDLVRILKEPEASLIKQYQALLKTEKVTVNFTDAGIEHLAKLAAEVNKNVENIGARRLHTVMEKLLEEVSFTATDMPETTIDIDVDYVERTLADITKNMDLSKFVL